MLCYPLLHMPRARELPRIARRRSKVHGWGVFALEPITKNTRIIDYAGELIDHKESLKRETRYLKQGCIWCFTVNRRWVRDANVGGNLGRFINHACKPNCYSQIVDKTIWIRAARNIEPGEELTYDYYTDGERVIECRCRPGCKRRL
jgi:SET domain-containing protein